MASRMKRRRLLDTYSGIHEDKEDRISTLPEDVILYIISFLDFKLAVQTSLVCTKWRRLWTSLTRLHFECTTLRSPLDVVNHVLASRNPSSRLSTITLVHRNVSPAPTNSILDYVISNQSQHYVDQISLAVPLVYLDFGSQLSCLTGLTSLTLENVQFRNPDEDSVDPFASLVNLRKLSLLDCLVDGVKTFKVSLPLLEILSIVFCGYKIRCNFVISAPKLLSFDFEGVLPPVLSMNQSGCLERVALKFWYASSLITEGVEMMSLFQKIRETQTLVICSSTVEALSKLIDSEVYWRQSPFRQIRHLKIATRNNCTLPEAATVISFFQNRSPNVSVTLVEDQA